MDTIQLQRELESCGVRVDSYSLDGSSEEAYCLEFSAGKWSVYYCERGIETNKRDFVSEAEACEYMLELLKRDPSTRKGHFGDTLGHFGARP